MHLILHLIKHCCQAKQHPNPLLDVLMSYLQTNTRLENLEVVERVDITLHHEWHFGRKKDDILNVTQFSTFNMYLLLNLIFVYRNVMYKGILKAKQRRIGS